MNNTAERQIKKTARVYEFPIKKKEQVIEVSIPRKTSFYFKRKFVVKFDL